MQKAGIGTSATESFRPQGSHFPGDTKCHVFSRLFPGKINEIPGQFDIESVFVPIMYI